MAIDLDLLNRSQQRKKITSPWPLSQQRDAVEAGMRLLRFTE